MNRAQITIQLAVERLYEAMDSRGLKVRLCSDPYNIDRVRKDLWNMCRWFTAESVWMDAHTEECAARNLALLSDLLAAHLRVKRYYQNDLREPADECKPQT